MKTISLFLTLQNRSEHAIHLPPRRLGAQDLIIDHFQVELLDELLHLAFILLVQQTASNVGNLA